MAGVSILVVLQDDGNGDKFEKEFRVFRGATKTLDCLQIVSWRFFCTAGAEALRLCVCQVANKVSLGQHIELTGLSCTGNLTD